MTYTSLIEPNQGGTGIDNASNTVTLDGNLTIIGEFSTTISVSGDTNITLPMTGTIVTSDDVAASMTVCLMAMTVENVDGTATASTLIGTTDSGMRFVPIFVNVEATAVTGFVTVSSLSVGTNAAAYDDILVITPLTGVSSANTVFQVSANSLLKSVPSATDIFVKITTGAVATSYNLRVSVLGFYF